MKISVKVMLILNKDLSFFIGVMVSVMAMTMGTALSQENVGPNSTAGIQASADAYLFMNLCKDIFKLTSEGKRYLNATRTGSPKSFKYLTQNGSDYEATACTNGEALRWIGPDGVSSKVAGIKSFVILKGMKGFPEALPYSEKGKWIANAAFYRVTNICDHEMSKEGYEFYGAMDRSTTKKESDRLWKNELKSNVGKKDCPSILKDFGVNGKFSRMAGIKTFVAPVSKRNLSDYDPEVRGDVCADQPNDKILQKQCRTLGYR